MRKIILTIFMALVMVYSITACGEETEEDVELLTTQEIVNNAIESFDNIKTYQFELDMTMHAVGEAESEPAEHTVIMDNSGTLDLENLQMKTDLSAGSGGEMMRVESYYVNGIVYAKPEVPGEESRWIKSEAPTEYWEMVKGVSGIENYKELLETAQVNIIGNEKVEGVDCYILELNPEMVRLYKIAMGPVGGGGQGGMLPSVPENLIPEIFRSFSVKQYVAKDTYFLMKVEINMVIRTTPELNDYLGEESDISVDINIVFLAYNYNQPVSIVVPSEALEAK